MCRRNRAKGEARKRRRRLPPPAQGCAPSALPWEQKQRPFQPLERVAETGLRCIRELLQSSRRRSHDFPRAVPWAGNLRTPSALGDADHEDTKIRRYTRLSINPLDGRGTWLFISAQRPVIFIVVWRWHIWFKGLFPFAGRSEMEIPLNYGRWQAIGIQYQCVE